MFLVTKLGESRDDNELHDAGEDEDHAGQHPDVKVGDVGDPGNILSDSAEHCRQGQKGRHACFNKKKLEIVCCFNIT